MSDLRHSLALSLLCAVALALPCPGGASAETKPLKLAQDSQPKEKKPEKKSEKKAGKEGAKEGAPAGAKLVATFGDWGAYTAQSGRAKICYALSEPKTRSPASLKDIKSYLFVSFRPSDNVRNEVAAVLNFTTKEGGPASLSIGATYYDLVTKGENAWVKNAADEAAVIGTMSKGGNLTLTATSARGNKTADKYSLTGFPQALERAKRDCP